MAVLVPCAGALLFGLLAHAVNGPAQRAFAHVAADGIFGLVVPIAALVIGDSVLGAEVRAGHVPLHLAVADADLADRARSVGGRFDRRARHDRARVRARGDRRRAPPESAVAAFVAAAVGSVAYVAVFIAIASLTRRTAVWSLAFVFLVERLLGTALTGIAQLSPTWESRAIFLGYLDHVPSDIVRTRDTARRRGGRPARDRDDRRARRRDLADEPHAHVRRVRLRQFAGACPAGSRAPRRRRPVEVVRRVPAPAREVCGSGGRESFVRQMVGRTREVSLAGNLVS